MGIIVNSLYVESFKTTINNVYIAVAWNDVVFNSSKIDPYKGTWITYTYSVWANKEIRDSHQPFITQVRDKVKYQSDVDVLEQVYTHIKSKLTGEFTDA